MHRLIEVPTTGASATQGSAPALRAGPGASPAPTALSRSMRASLLLHGRPTSSNMSTRRHPRNGHNRGQTQTVELRMARRESTARCYDGAAVPARAGGHASPCVFGGPWTWGSSAAHDGAGISRSRAVAPPRLVCAIAGRPCVPDRRVGVALQCTVDEFLPVLFIPVTAHQ